MSRTASTTARRRMPRVAAAGAAVVVVAAGIFAAVVAGDRADRSATPGTPSSSATVAPEGDYPTAPTTDHQLLGGAEQGGTPQGDTSPDAGTPEQTPSAPPPADADGDPGTDGRTSPLEVIPSPPPGSQSLGDLAPQTAPTAPAKADTSRDELADGFPRDTVPVLDGLTVVASSVTASDGRMQLGLEARTARAPGDVEQGYADALGQRGFAASPSPALPGTTALAFTRGQDGIVLTLRERHDGGTELSLAGALAVVG